MSEPIYKCWCKATDREIGDPRLSHRWATARRAWFRVFEDRVECGDWVIPASAITEAVLFESAHRFNPVRILRLRTAEATYQFGFNPWCRVGRHLPFEARTETIRLGLSIVSIVTRVALVAYLLYLLWRWLA